MKSVIVIHYDEIALKGKNRAIFEKKLVENVRANLKDFPELSVKRIFGRILVEFSKFDVQKVSLDKIKEKLSLTFGISNFSFGWKTDADMDKLANEIWKIIKEKKDSIHTFALRARRSDKNFPLNSMDIERKIGGAIRAKSGWMVDLDNPDLTVYLEIIEKGRAIFYYDKIAGPGGLPVSTSGRLLSLISSGFDSPVASYLLMKRGAKVDFLHFHSYPYTDNRSIENVKKIIQILANYQGKSWLFLAPLGEVQKKLLAIASSRYLVILYRRIMVRVANELANKEKIRGLITGESLGQVASQTIENIHTIADVSYLPILRPLIGFNKGEIISLAKKISTAEISSQPYEDCCSRFVPKNPVTKARLEEIEKIEKSLPVNEFVTEILEKLERLEIYKAQEYKE